MLQSQIDRIEAAADEAKHEFNQIVDARSSELKQQLHRGFNHHSRDLVIALQHQAVLLAAADAASTSLEAACAGSDAARALFDLCTRASSPSPANAAAEFQRSPGLTTSVPLLGQLHASRRAVWSSGSVVASSSEPPVKLKSHTILSRSSVSSDSVVVAKLMASAPASVSGGIAAAAHPAVRAAADCAFPDSASAVAPVSDFICSIGVKGSEDGQFDAPWGVAVNEEGSILVCEKNGNRVQVLQRSEEKGEWHFTKKNGFKGPRGVASFNGMVVVANTDCHELLLKPEMSLISTKKDWIRLGSGLLNNPNGVDIDCDLNIWVADTGNR